MNSLLHGEELFVKWISFWIVNVFLLNEFTVLPLGTPILLFSATSGNVKIYPPQRRLTRLKISCLIVCNMWTKSFLFVELIQGTFRSNWCHYFSALKKLASLYQSNWCHQWHQLTLYDRVRYLPHALTALKFREYSTDDAAKSNLLHSIAESSYMLGKYSDKEKLYFETFELRTQVLSAEHPFTLANMNNLAIVLDS